MTRSTMRLWALAFCSLMFLLACQYARAATPVQQAKLAVTKLYHAERVLCYAWAPGAVKCYGVRATGAFSVTYRLATGTFGHYHAIRG